MADLRLGWPGRFLSSPCALHPRTGNHCTRYCMGDSDLSHLSGEIPPADSAHTSSYYWCPPIAQETVTTLTLPHLLDHRMHTCDDGVCIQIKYLAGIYCKYLAAPGTSLCRID